MDQTKNKKRPLLLGTFRPYDAVTVALILPPSRLSPSPSPPTLRRNRRTVSCSTVDLLYGAFTIPRRKARTSGVRGTTRWFCPPEFSGDLGSGSWTHDA